MEQTFDELKKKTVAQLRELAQGIEHDALHGYSTMHKEELLPALCTALDIETHVHHDVVGINKRKVKARIRALKVERDAVIETRDKKRLKVALRRIHRLKRSIRKATA